MYDPNSSASSTGPASSSDASTASPSPGPDPTANWRDQRRAERDAHRQFRHEHGGWGGAPVGGMIILALGLLFLLSNFGFHLPQYWWAIFLLIPGAALLVSAIRFYRVDNAMSPRVIGPTIGGLVLLGLAVAVFSGMNWGIFWPVVLVVVGLGIVARRYWR